ncbi:hypothetical protein [Hanstruepera ponticola]|uniref:hypothetical protein n=1 Tax=Hanstruepera ponticola TaxID=2042995 RepID=UPI000CF0A8C0|nr:hypothetical protein [Hanstruepera ponticola]
MKTKYGVFIIESLSEKDGDYFDGELLEEILELSNIPVIYLSIENKDDLKIAIDKFAESEFRYLHFSFHANMDGIELTKEFILNNEFNEIIGKTINRKRVFLSACKGSNRNLASKLITSGAFSLIGTPINISFVKVALFWPAFFHAINELDKHSMKRTEINTILKACSKLFNTPINFYSFIKNEKNFMKRSKIRDGLIKSTHKLKIYN